MTHHMSTVSTFVRAFGAEFSDPTTRGRLISTWRRQLLPHVHPGAHLVPATIKVNAAKTLALASSFVCALQGTPLSLSLTNKSLSLFPPDTHVPPLALSDLSSGLRDACLLIVRSAGAFSHTSNFVSRFSASGFAYNGLLEVVFPREVLLLGLVLQLPELRDVWWHKLPVTVGPAPPRVIGSYIRQLLVLDSPPVSRRESGELHRYTGRDACYQFNVFMRLPIGRELRIPCRTCCSSRALNRTYAIALEEVRARGEPFWNTMSHLLSSLVFKCTRDSELLFGPDTTLFGTRVSWGACATGYIIENDVQKALCVLHAAAARRWPRRAYIYPLALAVARLGTSAGHCAVASWLAGTENTGLCPSSHVSVGSVDATLLDSYALAEGAPRDLVLVLGESQETPLREYVVSYESTGDPIHLGNMRICVSSSCGWTACDWDAFVNVGWG